MPPFYLPPLLWPSYNSAVPQYIPAMRLDPLSLKPWFLPLSVWRSSMGSISAKSYARLEAVRYHLDGVPLGWRDGFVVVQRPDSPEFALATDLKRPEDFAAMLTAVDEIAPSLPPYWAMMSLADQPAWYRRSGFRVSYPITCNVLYCPGGQWEVVPAIDLGAVSA